MTMLEQQLSAEVKELRERLKTVLQGNEMLAKTNGLLKAENNQLKAEVEVCMKL